MQINIAVIGDEKGTAEAVKSIKFPEIISSVIIWEDESFYRDFDPDSLCGADILLTAFYYKTAASQLISDFLSSAIGIPATHIWDYYKLTEACSPSMKAEKRLQSLPPGESTDGIILGISHGETGIIADRFTPGHFLNLAVSSSDIYSNYKTLELCCDCYGDRIRALKHLIFEIYDYSYFNYDVSMSSRYPAFLLWGGYDKDEHNLSKNPGYTMSFKELMDGINRSRYEGISQTSMEVWKMIRSDYVPGERYEERFIEPRLRFEVVDDEKNSRFKIGSYASKEFSETIRENTEYFKKMLELAYGINDSMNIHVLVMPRFAGAYNIEKDMLSMWKDPFYATIKELQQAFPFTFTDFVGSDFSKEPRHFYDAEHLNIYGAIKFSDMLNEMIRK